MRDLLRANIAAWSWRKAARFFAYLRVALRLSSGGLHNSPRDDYDVASAWLPIHGPRGDERLAKPTDIRLVESTSGTQRFAYRTPMKFGGRVVTDAFILDVHVVVETRDGRRGHGEGSMPMGNIWGWPSTSVSPAASYKAMVELGERLARAATDFHEVGHPLEVTAAMADTLEAQADSVTRSLGLGERMPRLAQMVAASPLEAAIHDAYGKALGLNSYDTLGEEFANYDLGHYLGSDFAGEYLDRYTLREPKPSMPLYHLVGALDPLFRRTLHESVGHLLRVLVTRIPEHA